MKRVSTQLWHPRTLLPKKDVADRVGIITAMRITCQQMEGGLLETSCQRLW